MTENIGMHLFLSALKRQTASNTGRTGTLWKETTALSGLLYYFVLIPYF